MNKMRYIKETNCFEKNIRLFKTLKLNTFNIQPIHYLSRINNIEYVTKTKNLIDSINTIIHEKKNLVLEYVDMEKKILNAYYIKAFGKNTNNADSEIIQSATLVVESLNQLAYSKTVSESFIKILDTYFSKYHLWNLENEIVSLITKEIVSRQINQLYSKDVLYIDLNIRQMFTNLMKLNYILAIKTMFNNYSSIEDSSIINDFWDLISQNIGENKSIYYFILSYIKLQLIKMTKDKELLMKIYYSLDFVNCDNENDEMLKKNINKILDFIKQVNAETKINNMPMSNNIEICNVLMNICSVV